MPAIRKYGEYKITYEYKKEIDELSTIIDTKVQEIKILKHNFKKQKFKKESIVYILRTIDFSTSIELDMEEILILETNLLTKNIEKKSSDGKIIISETVNQ